MRIPRAFLTFLVVAAVAVAVPPARAQTFPGTWTPLTRGGAVVTDAAGGVAAELDVVGDTSNPAAFVYSDADHLFFRIRVDGDPIHTTGTRLDDFNWGCAIDSDATLTTYEYLASLDATSTGAPQEAVTWRQNAGGANSPAEIAETVLAGDLSAATYSRTSAAGADWFVDFAIPWTTIRGGAAPLAPGASLRFVCGTSATAGNIGSDTFAPGGTLSATWSDPFVCGNGGCALDRDQDGVPDVIEEALGTNPTNKDSDGDGIPDNVELSATGGAGPFTAVHSDGDGVIDALDTDSDNDCRTDQQEGQGTYRNASQPNANPSAACAAAATPVCDTSTGSCVGCATGFGGGAGSCPFAALPTCQPAGSPLAGRCTQCQAGETTLCAGATPACNVTTGSCGACNGDHGGATSSVCPSAALPTCHLAGALAGRCTQCTVTNTGLCTGGTPACDVGTGMCEACNGDRGGGASRACPSIDAPRCDLGGGACAKCTSDADCGSGHTGPTCDVPSGQCIDVDTDGDGLNDTVEALLGTDPAKADTDGDGISDLVEVTPLGGGATTKVDTDGDGTFDALDLDSDGDDVPDAVEKTVDTDADGSPDFRDPDDDGDGIATKDEVLDAANAKVSDDVDGDGQKNWLDTDADGDGKSDSDEGRADEDGDGIPNYLDPKRDVVITDAGSSSSSSSGGSSSSSGGGDGGAGSSGGDGLPEGGAAVDEGVIEGTGLFCATSRGTTSTSPLLVLGAIGAALARRRRTRR